jgi:hypothetical protein
MHPTSRLLVFCCLLLGAAGLSVTYPQTPPTVERDPVRLPNGRLQRDAILKADYERNLRDAAELERLTRELKVNLEKNTEYVFSIDDVKKLERIEKLAKDIRSRMKRS